MHGFTIECWRELPLSMPPCSFPSEVLSVTSLSSQSVYFITSTVGARPTHSVSK